MKKIATVVVTYNRKELLLKNISHLRSQSALDENTLQAAEIENVHFDILIIDNASTDGTAQAIQPFIQNGDIHYFNTQANLGGAGGFNYGIRKAVELGYDYIWLMDDDCLPKEDALLELISADKALKGHYGFLSSVVLWTDGTPCKFNVPRHPLTKAITDYSPHMQLASVASFVSFWVPAAVVKEVGLPIKDFFIWTDDWEFARRISRKYDSYLVGKSIVIHASKENTSGSIVDCPLERIDRFNYIYRNEMVLYRGEGAKGYLYVFVRGLYHIAKILLRSKGNKLKKCKIVISSNIAGLRFHPEIEYVAPQ